MGAASDAFDADAAGRGRSDSGELAPAAVCETLTAVLSGHLDSLFETGPAEVRAAVARPATAKPFGRLAHGLASRFPGQALGTFAGRTVGDTVGGGQRFPTVKRHAEFGRRLDIPGGRLPSCAATGQLA